VVVDIVDASNLERNLYLTTQILEMGVPLVVALNMTDVAESTVRASIRKLLSERLAVPSCPMVASRDDGVEELRQCLDDFLAAPTRPGQSGLSLVDRRGVDRLDTGGCGDPSHRPRSAGQPSNCWNMTTATAPT
jgi:hypothetical protein